MWLLYKELGNTKIVTNFLFGAFGVLWLVRNLPHCVTLEHLCYVMRCSWAVLRHGFLHELENTKIKRLISFGTLGENCA